MNFFKIIELAKQKTPIDDGKSIPHRSYWGDDASTSKEVGQNITFEISKDITCSFPRSQLIRYEGGFKKFQNPFSKKDESRQYLRLEFPAAHILVQTDFPRQLLELVLLGRVSILVRSDPGVCQEITINYCPQPMPLSPKVTKIQPWIYTGRILIE
jgi:hypothetical protein